MPTSTEINPHDIEAALKSVHDQKTFLNSLLAETLNWPIATGVSDVDDISYDWSEADLRARDLSKKLIAGRVLQVQLTTDQAWGIFILEFASDHVFTTDRGMTGVLRQVLRGLVKNRNKPGSLPSWQRENLLFICTHGYNHFRIAHFKSPKEGSQTARLAAFGWGPDIPARTACEFNLNHLGWPDTAKPDGAGFDRWADAFNVEKVTKKFYGEYSHEFDSLRKAVKGLGTNTEDQKMFTQTLLNRLMFLRFIERKGWLTAPGASADDRDYLRLLFAADNYRGKSFYAGRLRKLFFEGLAVEGKQESEAIGKVVFLNGGLFEENALDEKVDDIDSAAFAPLLGPDGLFYRYNFTVQESTPLDVEVAVDPEMLGKVFEELVTGRHESGSYYTPRPVVSFMCREALKGYLTDSAKLLGDTVAAFVDQHDTSAIDIPAAGRLVSALDHLKAVDPACGSGAYLLGLLHEMVDLYRLLYSEKLKDDDRSLHDLKLRIISNSIYGVDIDKFATNIAMLRLWLSLSVDSKKPLPLPNLEFKIETGDSLLGPDPSAIPDLFREQLQRRADLLVKLKDKYLKTHNDTKHDQLDAIRKEERDIANAMGEQLGEGVIDWRIQFAEVFAGESAESTMEGFFPQMNKTPKQQMSFTVGEQRGGFDIVLANPPYISAMEFAKTRQALDRQLLNDMYRTAKGSYDLYVPFFERGLQLLRPAGSLAYITPNKYLSAKYAVALREYFLENVTLTGLVDLSAIPIFTKASVYPIVTTLRKGVGHSSIVEVLTPKHSLVRDFDVDQYTKKSVATEWLTLLPENIWGLLLSPHMALLKKLIDGATPLAGLGKINATTTAAEADEFGDYLFEGAREGCFKVVNTGTIDPYQPLWGLADMTHQGLRLREPMLPKDKLNPRRVAMYSSPKVLFAKMAKTCEAFWDQKGEFASLNTNCFYDPAFSIKLGYVCGFANSAVFAFIYSQFFSALRMNKGYFQFQAPQLRVIPLRVAPESEQDAISDLARRAQAATDGQAVSVDEIQALIDSRLFKIYEMADSEILALHEAIGRVYSPPSMTESSEIRLSTRPAKSGRSGDATDKSDLDDWLRIVSNLIDTVTTWAEARGWLVNRSYKHLKERSFGTYDAPVLNVKSSEGSIVVEPVARFISAGDGRVDLTSYPGMQRFVLIRQNDFWKIKTDSGMEWPEEWCEASFDNVVSAMTKGE